MDKKLIGAHIITKGGNTFQFEDTATTSDGTSAARSLANHNVIDAEGVIGESTDNKRYIIPYMAIDNAFTFISSEPATAPVDDNCKVQTPAEEAESGTLKITNSGAEEVGPVDIALKLSEPGTYGGIDFASRTGITDYIFAIVSIAAGNTLKIDGVPDGTQYIVAYQTDLYDGVVPGIVYVSSGDSPK